MNNDVSPATPAPQTVTLTTPIITLAGFSGMELVNQYIMGYLTLEQTNELLSLQGHKRVLTIIEKKLC